MQFTLALIASALVTSTTALPSSINSARQSCTTLVPTLSVQTAGPADVTEKRQTPTTNIFNTTTVSDSQTITILAFDNIPLDSFQYTLKVNLPKGTQLFTSGNPALKIDRLPDVQGDVVFGALVGEFTPSIPFRQEIVTIAKPSVASIVFVASIASNADVDGSVSFTHTTDPAVTDNFVGFYMTIGDCF